MHAFIFEMTFLITANKWIFFVDILDRTRINTKNV